MKQTLFRILIFFILLSAGLYAFSQDTPEPVSVAVRVASFWPTLCVVGGVLFLVYFPTVWWFASKFIPVMRPTAIAMYEKRISKINRRIGIIKGVSG